MPKIYFKSKDVQNIDVLQWNGVCYTRTGNYGTASKDSNIPLTDVIKFYGNCDTCEGGQVSLTPGTTTTVLSTAQQFQMLVPTLTSGQSTTLKFESDTSCDVVLSANASDQLVFDVESSGNGPHTFVNIGDTINFESCDLPPLTYDVTYAGTGSYILKFEQTTAALTANEGVDVENTFEDVELAELNDQELDDLKGVVSETVAEEYGVDPSQVETEFEAGSIRAITRIRRLYKYMVEQMQDKDTTSITNALTSMINSHPAIRPDIKQRMIQNVTTPPPLRISPVASDNNVYISNVSTLCFKASGTDLGGKVLGRKMYNNDCNTRLYMKDNQSMTISLKLDQGVVFDLFDSTGAPLRDTTEHYSVSGIPASGHTDVTISLTPGFTGNIHYKDVSNTLTGNPGPHRWSVPSGGNGTIYVKSTVPKPLPPYHPTLRCQTWMSFGKILGASREDVIKLANTVTEVISGSMPLGSGEFKIRTSLSYTPQAKAYMFGRRLPYGYPIQMVGRGTIATTTIEFPEDVSKPVYDLAYNLLAGPKPPSLFSSLSANMKSTISATDFSSSVMAQEFSQNCYVGNPDKVKPVKNCAQDVRECWDGTYLSRDPSNDCQFPPCPPEPRWFTHVVGLSGRTNTHDAYIQLTGNKANATSMYNTLSGFGDMPGHPSDYFVLKLRNEPTCYGVQLDPLKTGLVAERDIPTGALKLYRDYFKAPPTGYYRPGRYYLRQDYLLHKNLTDCAPVVNPPSDPIPTPTPTPTPTSPPISVSNETYNYTMFPQDSTGYTVSPGAGNPANRNESGKNVDIGLDNGVKYGDTIVMWNSEHPSHPLAFQVRYDNESYNIPNTGQNMSIRLASLVQDIPALYQKMYNDEQIVVRYYCEAHPAMEGYIYFNAD